MTDYNKHIETVNHLKKKLDKGVSFEKTMHILYKLQKIPISVKLLEETGIGYKLRELSKQQKNNDVGKTAKLIMMAWKEFVQNQPQQDEEEEERERETNSESEKSSPSKSQNSLQHQQQQQQKMDPDDNHYEYGDDEDGDNDCNETPRSDRSEEIFSQNNHDNNNTNHHQHKNKKHKKKKKKSKEQINDNSDDEQQRKERKKDKKRKHRDNNDDTIMDRNDFNNKRHKQNECDNNNFKNLNGDNISNHQYEQESRWSRQQQQPPPQQQKQQNNHRTYTTNDDMFSSVLNMNDQLMTTSSSSSKYLTGKATTSNSNNSNRNRSNYDDSLVGSNLNSIDREIMQSLSTYQPSKYDFYPTTSSSSKSLLSSSSSTSNYNFEQERQAATMAGMKFKGRTQVFAGSSKIATVPKVYKLQDICIKVLMNHLDKIYEVGDLPYFLLKPVFAKCTVQQLKRIEYFNPQLLEETDELWREFCDKEFKNKQMDRRHFNSWRDFYNHLVKQREEKLQKITKNINSKQRQAIPERQVQQIEHVKTPREIRRRQERMGNSIPFRPGGSGGGSSGSSLKASLGSFANQVQKPKTAPLMKKLLQLRQSKFRR